MNEFSGEEQILLNPWFRQSDKSREQKKGGSIQSKDASYFIQTQAIRGDVYM